MIKLRFFLSRSCIFRAVTWNSANIHTEKRESDSPMGREKHGRLLRSFFTPYCCIPSTLAALSLIFTAFQNIIECTKAVSIAGRLYSPVVNETLQSPHAPIYSEWFFFKDMNLAVWLTLNIAWNWSHKMWNWIQYSFLCCNTNTSNREAVENLQHETKVGFNWKVHLYVCFSNF